MQIMLILNLFILILLFVLNQVYNIAFANLIISKIHLKSYRSVGYMRNFHLFSNCK